MRGGRCICRFQAAVGLMRQKCSDSPDQRCPIRDAQLLERVAEMEANGWILKAEPVLNLLVGVAAAHQQAT